LVPVYSFGENDTYNQFPLDKTGSYYWLNKVIYRYTNVIFPVVFGRGILPNTWGVFPNNVPIRIVSKLTNICMLYFIDLILVGKPINVEKVSNPSDEQIKELHDKYCNELKALYNEYKDEFWCDPNSSPPNLELLTNPLK
jgi:hypothetical protein